MWGGAYTEEGIELFGVFVQPGDFSINPKLFINKNSIHICICKLKIAFFYQKLIYNKKINDTSVVLKVLM
jgi:hypothetical protein